MASLEERLNKFLASNEIKQRIHTEVLLHPDFGRGNSSGGTKALAVSAEKEMVQILKECINELDSESVRFRFISGIRSSVYFVKGTGWVVDVYFDEDTVTSNSLYWQKYEMGAYLPVIFDQGYEAANRVWGYTSDGVWTGSRTSRDAANFISKAADRFNRNHSNDLIFVEYNEVYGGALQRVSLARGVF